jgi:hypothetical protein
VVNPKKRALTKRHFYPSLHGFVRLLTQSGTVNNTTTFSRCLHPGLALVHSSAKAEETRRLLGNTKGLRRVKMIDPSKNMKNFRLVAAAYASNHVLLSPYAFNLTPQNQPAGPQGSNIHE